MQNSLGPTIQSTNKNNRLKVMVMLSLTFILLLSGSHPPLYGAEFRVPLSQTTPCSALGERNYGNWEPLLSLDDRHHYFEIFTTLKRGFINEKIDVFMDYDVDTVNVSSNAVESAECSWVAEQQLHCYVLVANITDTSGISRREGGIGGIFVKSGHRYEIMRGNNANWWLDDGEQTVIIVDDVRGDEPLYTAQIETTAGETFVFDSFYSPVKEIPISFYDTISFNVLVTIDGETYTRQFSDYPATDNTILTLDVTNSGNISLREATCRQDGSWQ